MKSNKITEKDKDSIYNYAGMLLPRDYFDKDKLVDIIRKRIRRKLREGNKKNVNLGKIIILEINLRKKKALLNQKLTKELKNKTKLNVNDFNIIDYGSPLYDKFIY